MDIGLFRRFADHVLRDFNATLDVPLRRVEIHLLTLLHREKHKPMHFYARHVGLEKGSFTYLVEVMEEKGYLIRSDDKSDRRNKRLVLTEKGRVTVDRIIVENNQYIEDFLDAFDEKDKQTLLDAYQVIKAFFVHVDEDR